MANENQQNGAVTPQNAPDTNGLDPNFQINMDEAQTEAQNPYAAYEAARRAAEEARHNPMVRQMLLNELGAAPQAPVQQPQQIATPYDAELQRAKSRKDELDAAMKSRELSQGEAAEYYRLDNDLYNLPRMREQYIHTERVRQESVIAAAPSLIESSLQNFVISKPQREKMGITDEIARRVLTEGVNSIIANGQGHLLANPETRKMLMHYALTDMIEAVGRANPPAPPRDTGGARSPQEVRATPAKPGTAVDDGAPPEAKQFGMSKKEWEALGDVTGWREVDF